MNDNRAAAQIIESLRKGIPPQHGIDQYAVGNEKFMENIAKWHLSGLGDRGIIRFISGSWGAGKTHFFRQMRELAFANGCMVSNVELGKSEAPLDKFERVFYSIVRRIATPISYERGGFEEAAPFGIVLRETLAYLGSGVRSLPEVTTYDQFHTAEGILMANLSIDIDFKKMVVEYWRTFVPDAVEPSLQEQTRAEILQWFGGEGTIGTYRRRFLVNKTVNKDNAKAMLQALAGFVRLAGYRGLVILFDEAEMSFTAMRNTQLKDAHNNLLALINNVEALAGLFLIYATVPEFFNDQKHGIEQYGALAGRIGKPQKHPPRALDNIWDLDKLETGLPEYQAAARKIRDIYALAYQEADSILPSDNEMDKFISSLDMEHPRLAGVRFWRVLVTCTVRHCDNLMEGYVQPAPQVYEDMMDSLRDL